MRKLLVLWGAMVDLLLGLVLRRPIGGVPSGSEAGKWISSSSLNSLLSSLSFDFNFNFGAKRDGCFQLMLWYPLEDRFFLRTLGLACSGQTTLQLLKQGRSDAMSEISVSTHRVSPSLLQTRDNL